MLTRTLAALALIGVLTGALAGCGGSASAGSTPTLILGAYSAPSAAFARIIPLFQQSWKKQSGQDVTFKQSYQGSGAQARAIIQGFQADVAALSLQPDLDKIVKAGLITHDWQSGATKGIITNSVVALAVRKGNPKNIHDWADLAKPGIQILTPNPATSGGAWWNILALYGAALRGNVTGVAANDRKAAASFLTAVLKNVKVMDKDARSSITNFEKGIGDVAISYESEVLLGQQKGATYELVIPRSTILIQSPIAVVDTYANQHGTQKVAQAFINFLLTPAAQQIFAESGYRPVDSSVAQANASKFAPVTDQFTIDYFGGWKQGAAFFAAGGIYAQAIAAVQG